MRQLRVPGTKSRLADRGRELRRVHRLRHLRVAAYVVPSTGSELDLAAANGFTALGGLCFLVGAVLLLPESAALRDVAA